MVRDALASFYVKVECRVTKEHIKKPSEKFLFSTTILFKELGHGQ